MKFRLVQINRLRKKNGWNLMFGKTFVRSFHWSQEAQARLFLEKANTLLKEIDLTCYYSKELIVSKYPHWIDPPKDCYLGGK